MLSATIITGNDISNGFFQSSKEKKMWIRLGTRSPLLVLWKIYLVIMMFYQLLFTWCMPRDEWIFYSGCSYHMCPVRDWFLTYQVINGKDILTENDMPCKTIGIGSIKIQMHDGLWQMFGMYQSWRRISFHYQSWRRISFHWENLMIRVTSFQVKIKFWDLINDLLSFLKERSWTLSTSSRVVH